MATPQRNRIAWLRRSAFASGLVAALTLVALGQLPAAGGTLGLDVLVTTLPTGELAVAPVGRVGSATALCPGAGELRGRVTLQSQADDALTVRVRQRPSIGDADRALRVRLTAAGPTLYEGSAGGRPDTLRGVRRWPAPGEPRCRPDRPPRHRHGRAARLAAARRAGGLAW